MKKTGTSSPKTLTDEERLRRSIHAKKLGDANKGLKRSEETKQKMRFAHLGNFQDEEWKEKRISQLRGRIVSEETVAKRKKTLMEKYGTTNIHQIKKIKENL